PSLSVTTCRRPTPTLFPYTTLFRSHQHLLRGYARPGSETGIRETALILISQTIAEIAAEIAPGFTGDIGHKRDQARCRALQIDRDRKSTRLNSSHVKISYAVFCLKK